MWRNNSKEEDEDATERTENDEGNSLINRRNAMKMIGASGATTAIAGLSGITQAKQIASEMDVREVSGTDRAKGIKQARSDSEFEILHDRYISEGWKTNSKEWDVLHVTETDGNTRYVVSATFEPSDHMGYTDSDIEKYLLYNGIDTIPNLPEEVNDMKQTTGIQLSSPDEDSGTSEIEKQVQVDTVQNSSIVSESDTIDSSDVSLEKSTPTVSPEACVCTKRKTVCENTNYGCFLTTAGAYATAFVACGTCYSSSGVLIPSCGYCVAAVLGSGGATLSCDIGSGCRTKTVCLRGHEAMRQC